jgi:hypothetical protein
VNAALTPSLKRGTGIVVLFAMIAIAMKAETDKHDNSARFDTDSKAIGIDNRCSACISHDTTDFVGELRDSHRRIKGIGGILTSKIKTGTIKWSWEDDQGVIHDFIIPNSYYVPDTKVRLLSTQHWAQTQKDIKPKQGTKGITNANNITLEWKQGKYKRTISLGRENNVATFYLAPGYKKFKAFCTEIGPSSQNDIDPILACETGIVSDEDESPETQVEFTDKDKDVWKPATEPQQFDLNVSSDEDTAEMVDNEEDRQTVTDASLLLKYHHKFGHMSFTKLQLMAKIGVLPKRLTKCNIPTCSACMFAKATKEHGGVSQARHTYHP